MLSERIRAKLKRLRKHHRLTLRELSQKTKFSAPYLCQILNGSRDGLSIDNLDILCRALDTKPSDILAELHR